MSLKNKNFFEYGVRFHVFPKTPEILGTQFSKISKREFKMPRNVKLRLDRETRMRRKMKMPQKSLALKQFNK